MVDFIKALVWGFPQGAQGLYMALALVIYAVYCQFYPARSQPNGIAELDNRGVKWVVGSGQEPVLPVVVDSCS